MFTFPVTHFSAAAGAVDLSFTDTEIVLSFSTGGGTPTITDIASDGSLLVAVGSDLYTSSTGDNGDWTNRTRPSTLFQAGIATDGTSWVTCPGLGNAGCWESTDPTGTWNARTVVPSGFMIGAGITYDSVTGLFICFGTSLAIGRLFTSPDGITWTERTMTGFVGITSVYRSSDGLLVAVGSSAGARYATSSNGTTWAAAVDFDAGVGAPQAGLFDADNDNHWFVTGSEFGVVPNNSGPPELADFTELGTDEGSLVNFNQLQQPVAGGPISFHPAAAEFTWSNPPFTVVQAVPDEDIITAYNAAFGMGEYYVCGRDGSNGIIERLI